ncbi:general secretion pathway protein GspK [bacterium]|nr:general secretion pathway protein GspK [bacterium]
MIKRQNNNINHVFKSESGIALLLVLFVVSLLIIIAAEFAFTTRMEIMNARNFKEDIEGYFYAQAGFQYAMTEIIGKYDEIYLAGDGQVGFYRKWFSEDSEMGNPDSGNENEDVALDWPPLPIRSGIPIGNGKFDYIITDEEGRLNINYLNSRLKVAGKSNREVFKELLLAIGIPEGDEPDIIIDSIMDWIDKGDEHRLNGAESDWYEHNYMEKGFTQPYSCKNAKLDTIDELLLIRGITPEILYGSDSIYASGDGSDETIIKGLLPYITVYGYHRKVNLGTAPPLLLKILDPEGAEEALENRTERDSEKKKRLMSRTFRIDVRGYSDAADVEHVITAVVRRSQRRESGGGAEIYYWNDNALAFGRDLWSFQEDVFNETGYSGL